MKPIHIIAFLLGISIISCKEKDPVFIGGKGGNGVLLVIPQHHGRNIDSCTVYIKYNTRNAADTYDDSAKCVNLGASPVARITGLKRGDYYLYGYGFDTAINQNVKGGKAYTVTEENTQTVYLPVSED